MLKSISDKIKYADWVAAAPRYKALDIRDRLLDGTFYDHLLYAFYDELKTNKELVPILDRRPSAQFRLPRFVGRWCARKLFSGRHVPRIKHKDKGKAKAVEALLKRASFIQKMAEIVLLGSVGSIAVTFRLEEDGEGAQPRVAMNLWRAKFCVPSFDPYGELSELRVQYQTPMGAMRSLGYKGDPDIKDDEYVWFIRDYTAEAETTYRPVKAAEWNPVRGFVKKDRELVPWEEQVFKHGLGFVPGHWFVNLTGGTAPDGVATWEDAIPNSIEIDYTLSQVGRGTRYNCAPQLVIIGQLLNGDDIVRGPTTHLQLESGVKDEDGLTRNAGDAKLLEMTGSGTKAALELIDKLRNFALEQIAASRKNPEKMHAPLSGRAMEYMDEDSDDLVMDLRSQYGEHGALPLIQKLCRATKVLDDPSGLTLQWPRLTQPTPDEVLALVQAFQIALDPLSKSTPPSMGSKPAAGGSGAVVPPSAGTGPEEGEQLLTIEEARSYLAMVLDLNMLEMDDGDEAGDDPDEDTSPASEQTPTAPQPLPDDIQAAPGPDQPETQPPVGAGGDASAAAFASAMNPPTLGAIR